MAGVDVYFPLHDRGIDILAVRGSHHCSLQVKESQYFSHNTKRTSLPHSWHQIRESNINPPVSSKKTPPDFVVFLTYCPLYDDKVLSKFEEEYIVIPLQELKERLPDKRPSKGTYSFYFTYVDGKAKDIREHIRGFQPGSGVDYSGFMDNWPLIDQALEQPAIGGAGL